LANTIERRRAANQANCMSEGASKLPSCPIAAGIIAVFVVVKTFR